MGRRLPGGRSAAMEDVGFAAGYLPLPDRLKVHEALRFFADLHDLPIRDGTWTASSTSSTSGTCATSRA